MDSFVVTITLWLLPVAGVFALRLHETVEDKMVLKYGFTSNWKQLISCGDMILVCQQDVCGCDSSSSSSNNNDTIIEVYDNNDDDDDVYEVVLPQPTY